MEISSFSHLLRNISDYVRARNESAIDCDDLIRKIFTNRGADDDDGPTDSDYVVRPEYVLGRYDEKEKLLSELLPDMDNYKGIQLSVIPILGCSGIGKTTLAQLVYDEKVVKKHFQVRAWVRVEGEELNLHHAAHAILKSTMDMSCAVDDLDELAEMVRDVLESQRCLVVFDGIESMAKDSWLHMLNNWFGFVDLGSKVLITTSSKDVAHLVSDHHFVLSKLPPQVGLSMYRYLSFGSSDEDADNSNSSSPIAKNLSALCHGIPLSLKLVGSLLRYNGKLRDLLSSVDLSDGPCDDAFVAILLCVRALPRYLRQCLAYCTVFPEGLALSKEKITRMWIANGLVQPSLENDSLSLHKIADSYFHQLLCRSFFTDITCNEYDDDFIEFRIPRLIHKMAENVARIVHKEKLGLIGSIGGDLVFPYHSKHLKTLIFSPTIDLGGCSLDHSFVEFKDLQSLDLSCSGIRSLPDDICALQELRYLDLSHTLIDELPDSITDLSWLQTLNLTGCYYLRVLPKEMRNLTRVEHLDLRLCCSLSSSPSGIGLLTSLTSMPLFVLGKDSDCARLRELGLLNRLRGRLEIKNLENVTDSSEARDAKIDRKSLHHLQLSWSQNADDCFHVLELLEPNPRLKVLDVTGYMGLEFPKWISSINSLTKISITDCGCKELPSLGQLPFLKELQLKEMMNLEHVGPELYGDAITDHVFPSLEQLGLYDLPRLSEWSASNTSSKSVFRSLKTLTIQGCLNLTTLPSLPTLSNLTVSCSHKSILSSVAAFTSLSSLLINDMELGVSNFQDLSWLDSLKKLVLRNITDKLIVNISHIGTTFTALQHLAILHCHQLTDLCLFHFSSLVKLHIVDCPNLFRMLVREETDTPLVEMVVEDCPLVFSEIFLGKLSSLRKLILKNCGAQFTLYYAGAHERLQKLEYLSINRCPRIERELQTFPSLISHVPCIIVGDHKANYKDIQDSMDVPIKASCYAEAAEDLIGQISDAKARSCFGADWIPCTAKCLPLPVPCVRRNRSLKL